jgi:hypothetical protein
VKTFKLAKATRSTKEKTDRPTPMKKQQAWNGLYRAAAVADDVTAQYL